MARLRRVVAKGWSDMGTLRMLGMVLALGWPTACCLCSPGGQDRRRVALIPLGVVAWLAPRAWSMR